MSAQGPAARRHSIKELACSSGGSLESRPVVREFLQSAPFSAESVIGFLHTPAEPNNCGLVLTHGAGGNCQSEPLITVANTFALAGFYVLRFDLAFRLQRRVGPPHPSQSAKDRAGIRAAVEAMRKLVTGPVLMGGLSYGGRQASMVASEDGSIADALVLLSYPLHPPGKAEQKRTAHFEKLRTPALFVQGSKDPFGTPDEMRTAISLLPGSCELSLVEGAGHDLKRGKFDVDSLVVQPALRLLVTVK